MVLRQEENTDKVVQTNQQFPNLTIINFIN